MQVNVNARRFGTLLSCKTMSSSDVAFNIKVLKVSPSSEI